jgi:2'-5' RNA ligase
MPAAEHLYFIALVPTEPLRSQLWELKEEMRDKWGSKASLNSPAHITLHMPFELKENRERAVIEGLRELADGYKAFDVELDGYGAFPPKVIHLHVATNDALKRLQADVHSMMKRGFNVFNATHREGPFKPHITLAFRDLKKAVFEEAWSQLKEKEFSARWLADGITLLRHDGKLWQELALAEFTGADETVDVYS